jgi:hypothetical protein
LVLVAAGLTGTASAAERVAVQQAVATLKAQAPQAFVYEDGARITRVGGQPLAFGASPEQAAEQFRLQHAGVFGVAPEDLAPLALADDAPLALPIMWEPEVGDFKFVLVRYQQVRDGIPVFRGDLRLLVRNDTGFPLVLAASSLRDLGDFRPDLRLASGKMPTPPVFDRDLDTVTPPQTVIWAGIDDQVDQPRLAYTFIASRGDFEKWLYVVDAATGKVLLREDQIIMTDVTGNVSGMATTGPKADYCAEEIATAMPYASVSVSGGSSAYADANGNFTIPNGGTSAVTVNSPMTGRYFYVSNAAGGTETLSLSVTPPGPANFLHNAANTTESVRSQINGYIQANVVRDFCLIYNPNYPTIATQTNFPVYVNRTDGYCPGNAWYDGVSLNLCASGSGYPNTAWSNIIHHEYGHHIVAMGGSGQGAYGEGMGDCVGLLIADDPICGYGFTGNCNTGIRTGDNTLRYPCSGEIHTCGQLLSGCVWSTRNELRVTNPTTYLQILSGLTINSVLLHTGTNITPQITIDFLTLDDNDGNINNGTPHRNEICAGFGAHNMACPPLVTGLSVTPTDNFAPSGPVGGPFTPASINYTLENLNATPINYTVAKTATWLTLSSAGGTLAGHATTAVAVGLDASASSLPAGMYADTVTFTNTTDHVGDTTRAVTLTVGGPSLQMEWNLDTNPGWTTSGQWAWGHPTGGGGQYGGPDPTSGHTGPNVYGYNLAGDYANLIPEYHLTSTAINCSGLTSVQLRFWRWLGVEQPAYDHAYVRVSNNGSTWTTVWQNTAQVADTAWSQQEFDISAVADNQPTVYLRWTMGATDSSWQFCGWNIDDIQIWAIGSQGPTHTLTVSTQGQGTVALNPPGPTYPEGTSVTLTANPAAGWTFDHWSGALTGSTNPATLVMDADKAVTAVFLQNSYTLTVNVTGQGNVALNPVGPTYPSGTSVTLTATAASGWRFDHWAGALTGATNPATVVMDANKTVTAVFVQATGGPTLLMVFSGTTTVPGVGSVTRQDIVAYDVGLNTWSLYFDGSDVGLSAFGIDALARLPSGELLISTDVGGSLAGLTGGPSGTTITSSDIVKFTPTSLGANTAGTWSFYFDGSDVGLTQSTENIDALAVTPDGKLLISTTGDPSVPGLSGLTDEDVLRFNPTSLGATTAGTWSYYFDGSDVGLTTTSEDVDSLAVMSSGKLLLSTLGNFSVPGVSGTSQDILQFTPTSLGTNTAGTYLMYLDLSTKGIAASANVNALEIIE